LEQYQLTAARRKTTGNGPARVLRRNGRIPAVLYGPDTDATLLSVNTHEFELVLKNHNINQMVLNLVIENGDATPKPVMIKELQAHPVTNNLIHADFYEISMTRKIWVNVPVVVHGKSIGEERGGIFRVKFRIRLRSISAVWTLTMRFTSKKFNCRRVSRLRPKRTLPS
jgi:large subunit ribosomal protein L25